MRRRFFVVALLTLLPTLALAAGTIKLNLEYPSFGGFNLANNQDLISIIGWLYYAIVTVSGLAAFVMLVWGGI
ncbi:MAG: hypothetical protein HYU05_00610, partial [Candidatus Wildermuthbacteria bacterium]|nr:hypothetical protein [Candidatus Wildermuthbacteria bacterium]